MLTDKDLKRLKNLLDSLEERLDQRIENESLEIQKEITLLEAKMKREFKRVHEDQNLIMNTLTKNFWISKTESKNWNLSPASTLIN